MTISRKLTSIATAVALAATSLGTVTTSASAQHGDGGYRGGGYDGGRHYSRHDDRGWRDDGYRGGRDRYYARHYKKSTTPASTSPSASPP